MRHFPRVILLAIPVILAVWAVPTDSPAGEGRMLFPSLSVSNRAPMSGDPVIVEVSVNGAVDNLILRWKGTAWPMRETSPGRYEGLIGVDLEDPEGPAVVSAEGFLNGARFRVEAELMTLPRKFDVQELTLPKGMAEFDSATLR
ncbi:MAG TPA: hypothetical protein VLB08_05110, partial [Candidatus Deferrimicrobium sp.]|nr:hypothetical protein [Candidatus Deferrimicrobium sp.]